MPHVTWGCRAALIVGLSAATSIAQDDAGDADRAPEQRIAPPPRPEALKAIGRFAGRWRHEVKIIESEFAPPGLRGQGETIGHTILDGWFTQVTGYTRYTNQPPIHYTILSGCEKRTGRLFSTIYDSTGEVIHLVGDYDAEHAMITWRSEPFADGLTAVITDRIIGPNERITEMVTTGARGRVVLRSQTKSTRLVVEPLPRPQR